MDKKGVCVLSTGGTGGHVLPCIALATDLSDLGWEVIIFTDERGSRYFDKNSNKYSIEIVNISSETVTRRKKLLALSHQLPLGAFHAGKLMLRKKPKFVIGFGGVSTFPILLTSVLLRVPLFIQEQNAVLGRVNRFFQKFSVKVFCHFSNTLYSSSKNSMITGNPVRKKVLKKLHSQYLEPGPWPNTILVLGGSQGARLLSDVIPSCIEMLSKKTKDRLTIFHQARRDDIDRVLASYSSMGLRACVKPFFEDVERLMSESQVIICRAGSNTLSDISIVGRPSILIPLKQAKDDHQLRNARLFSEEGGAIVVEESPNLAEDLFKKLSFILKAPSKTRNMADKVLKMGKPYASQNIIRTIEGFLGEKK